MVDTSRRNKDNTPGRHVVLVRGVGLRFGHNLRALNWARVTLGEASHKWLRQNAREGENSDAATQKAL